MYCNSTIWYQNGVLIMKKSEELKRKVLQELSRRSEVTRQELIEKYDLRPASLFSAIDDLKAEGLVVEPERQGARTGRRSPNLTLAPDYGCFVGIELQIRKTTGVIIDMRGEIIHSCEITGKVRENLKDAKAEIVEAIENLRSQAGERWNNVLALCFADPGLVDVERGISLRAVNIPEWYKFNSASWLTEVSGVPSIVYPETLTKTFMEYYSRYPEPPKSLLHMEMGAGIGAGFIKNNELFIGDTGRAMEIGHVVIAPDGPLCRCGNRGCLEAMAGENGIRAKVEELIENGVNTALSIEDFSLTYFVECVKRADKPAVAIAHELGVNIGRGLASAVALLNPSAIVLSGEISLLGQSFIDTVKRTLTLQCFPGSLQHIKLEISSVGEFAAAHGAALLSREKFFQKRS